MMRNRKVAVTGGIGVGKSEACRILSEKGYPVVSCDDMYAELLNTREFSSMLEEHFPGVSDKNNRIDRQKLSKIVFSDREKLDELTKLTNPLIIKKALSRLDKVHSTAICEVPLLFENGYEKYFDDIIVIMRNYDKRVDSIVKRSGLTPKEAEMRINSQFDYDSSDLSVFYVIYNNGTFDKLSSEISLTMNKIERKK